mgnify:CR=1 FL=1
MNNGRAQVHIHLNFARRPHDRHQTAIVRVHTPDLALIGEGIVGGSIEVPLGENYVASAVAPGGQPVALPKRFDVRSQDVTVDLEARSSSEPVIVSDTFLAPDIFEKTTSFYPDIKASLAGNKQQSLVLFPSLRSEHRYPFAFSFEGASPLITAPMSNDNSREKRSALIPFDMQYGEIRWPEVGWITSERGQLLPNIDFHDDRISALQDMLRYRMLSAAQSTAEAAMEDLDHEAMREKMRSPLAAVLGGLLLLQDAPQRLERIEKWALNLYNWFPWLSDALPLRVELLARMGRHSEALKTLNEVERRGVPWTREGLRVLVTRMASYSGQTMRGRPILRIPNKSILKYKNLLAGTDPDCVYLCINVTSLRGDGFGQQLKY